jgi:hypothetical protein
MKHKNSILLCQMDDGRVDMYINGIHAMCGDKIITPVDKIANCTLKASDCAIMFQEATRLLVTQMAGDVLATMEALSKKEITANAPAN